MLRTLNQMRHSSSYPIKTLQMTTCGPLYSKLKQLQPKLFKHSPTKGLNVTVEYADTKGDDQRENIILALHGIPGHHKDYTNLINFFMPTDYRFIALNFPDFQFTRKTMSFWHTSAERVQFVKDFLRQLNIDHVTCLICHSSGIHPTSFLWSDDEMKIKSLCICNPPSADYFNGYHKDISQYILGLCSSKWGLAIVDRLNPQYVCKKLALPPMSFSNLDDSILTQMVLNNSQFKSMDERYGHLMSKATPTLYIMSEKDKVIPKKWYYDHCKSVLSVKDNDFTFYDVEGNLEMERSQRNWLKPIVFRGGGHFTHQKYAKQVGGEIVEMLKELS